MKYVGIDLHKKTISGCVVVKERGKKKIAARKRLECRDEAGIKSWSASWANSRSSWKPRPVTSGS
jgi:hypothetical protein